ncbi:hypothetical protein MMC25_005018 [Agyrium rufum]|nr:hypothetical protein [Agyrium rufum]
MAALSPMESGGSNLGNTAPSSNYGSGDSSGARSPLAMNIGFIKSIAEKKQQTRDGQPPKRRGPKPDSKPALTRRQELNRQAQRTHRERKEVYIKNLEDQIMSLKESYTGKIQERNSIADENRRLKDLLHAHGISDFGNEAYSISGGAPSAYTPSVSDSRAGSYAYQAFSPSSGGLPSPGMPHGMRGSDAGFSNVQQLSPLQVQQSLTQSSGIDHDQVGVDFVLALERPCMSHSTYLCQRSRDSQDHEPFISGHALMITCPTPSYLASNSSDPFEPKIELPNADLMKLLNLSRSLPLDGEYTPVEALNYIRSHDRYFELTLQDFETIIENLRNKSRCHGFGAVLEEFEIRDVLTSVFSLKTESISPMKTGNSLSPYS